MKQKKYDQLMTDKFLFRRQFILGPHFIENFTSWKKIKIKDKFCLTVHPDLNTYQCVVKDTSVTLIGYVLDPLEPQSRDDKIIDKLAEKIAGMDKLSKPFDLTYDFGGRWILIVDDGKELRLFNDPMGLRQTFYTNILHTRDLWCASQPGIIAEILNLEIDKAAGNEFINSKAYKTMHEIVWPGDSTPYKEINHLLPNHYIDLNTGSHHRYWPDRKIDDISLEMGVEKTADTIRALIKSASHRYSLAFAMTAGWDSRLLLAASREISHNIFYFTHDRWPNDPDVLVSSRLLGRLGLKHTVVKYPTRMDPRFERIYKRNVTASHDLWGTMAQGLYDHHGYPKNTICIKGNASEIARVRIRFPAGVDITAKELAMSSTTNPAYKPLMRECSFVVKSWEKWLLNLGDLYNIHLLDLFYWEHFAGNFASMTQAEWDIIQDVFTPYNCRNLLTTMLAVDEKYRDHDDPILYRKMIKHIVAGCSIRTHKSNKEAEFKRAHKKNKKTSRKNLFSEDAFKDSIQ